MRWFNIRIYYKMHMVGLKWTYNRQKIKVGNQDNRV